MLAAGTDNALLRFSLGQDYLNAGDAAIAATHLQRAVQFDAGYTAAWKLLGRALADSGQVPAAITAYRQGIAVAQRKGDKQALREMEVFLRRAEKQVAPPPD
jgi:Tfp pilus assembly protein PilF